MPLNPSQTCQNLLHASHHGGLQLLHGKPAIELLPSSSGVYPAQRACLGMKTQQVQSRILLETSNWKEKDKGNQIS